MKLSLGVGSTWRETLVNWGAQLRKAPFFAASEAKFTPYSPNVQAFGTMTVAAISPAGAGYFVFGDFVFFYVDVTCTLGGVATTIMYVDMPPVACDPRALFTFNVALLNTGRVAGSARVDTNNNLIAIRRYDESNFNLGAGTQIILSGWYKRS